MSIVLGKASMGRHFAGLGGGGGAGGIVSPGIDVALEETEITATPEPAQIDVAIQGSPISAELPASAITATPQQSPLSVTVIPPTIVAPVVGGSSPPFSGQAVSVDFDGATEYLRKANVQRLGLLNAWSSGVWWRPAAGTSANQPICGFGTALGFPRNRSALEWDTSGGTPFVSVECGDNFGLRGKHQHYNNLATPEFWNLDIWTWDGTSLLLYHAGVFVAPDAQIQNDSVTMNDSSDRQINIATDLAGGGGNRFAETLVHSHGLWRVTLTPAAILELWNGGAGRSVDWGSDGAAYTASADLWHWYRLGLDPADIGKDYGNASILINVGDDAVGIDASDIVIDSP